MAYSYIRIVLICASVFTLGCATSWRLKVADQNSENIKKIYLDGYELAVGQTENIVYGLTGEKEESGYLRIYAYVKNISNKSINFIPEKTELTYCDYYGCENLETIPAHKYIQKLKSDQALALGIMAFTSGLNSYNAGVSRSTTNTSVYGSAYGTGGYATGSAYGTSTTTTYDGAAAEASRQRDMVIIQNQSLQYNNINNAIENGLVKSVTLFSGQEIGGNIMIKHPPSSSGCYKVSLNIGEEHVNIYFNPEGMGSERCDVFKLNNKSSISGKSTEDEVLNAEPATSSIPEDAADISGSKATGDLIGWTGAYIIGDKGPFRSKITFESIEECKKWAMNQAELFREKEFNFKYECRNGEEILRQRVW